MSRRGVWAGVACGAVVMAALVVAATGRPTPVLSRPSATDTISRLPTTSVGITPPAATGTVETTTGGGQDISPLWGLVAQVLIALAALVLLVVVARLVLAFLRRPGVTRHEEPDFAVPDVPEELLESTRRARRALEEGEPRNAIVAAWLDLETSAGATGLPRDPAETSSEYTARVLRTWDVDHTRLDDLAGLYREARFSRHDLGEEHRRRAIADLVVLHDDLDRLAGARGATETTP